MSKLEDRILNHEKIEEIKIDDLKKYLVEIYAEITKLEKVGEAVDDSAVKSVLALADVNLIDKLTQILTCNEEDHGVRVIAFYILCTRYRRMKEFTKFSNLLNEYDNIFKNEEIYKIQKAYFYITYFCDKNQLMKAFNSWEYIDENYKKMPAFIQIYVDTVALCFENNLFDIKKQKDQEILVSAIELINIAIKNRDYAKFYATLGRLQNCNEEYDKAIMNINIAIDKEDVNRSDYAIRINEYELTIAKIKISNYTDNKLKELDKYKAELDKYKEELSEMKDEVAKSKYDNLSFLGFFSAVISMIIGTIQTTSSTVLVEKYQVLIALAGTIIIAFGSLNLIMLKKDNLKYSVLTTLLMFVLGMSIIAVSIGIIPNVV